VRLGRDAWAVDALPSACSQPLHHTTLASCAAQARNQVLSTSITPRYLHTTFTNTRSPTIIMRNLSLRSVFIILIVTTIVELTGCILILIAHRHAEDTSPVPHNWTPFLVGLVTSILAVCWIGLGLEYWLKIRQAEWQSKWQSSRRGRRSRDEVMRGGAQVVDLEDVGATQSG
jgi:hypothetical protein